MERLLEEATRLKLKKEHIISGHGRMEVISLLAWMEKTLVSVLAVQTFHAVRPTAGTETCAHIPLTDKACPTIVPHPAMPALVALVTPLLGERCSKQNSPRTKSSPS